MKLCEDCLEQCIEEMLPSDSYVLFSLDGTYTLTEGLTRREIYEIVNNIKATQINEILRKLEFVGLIKSNNNRKNILYCLTKDGAKAVDELKIKLKMK